MKKLYRWITGFHIYIGIGAAAGGSAAVFNPYSPMGMPLELLESSPFHNYLIPGFFLFSVLGLGNMAVSVYVLKRLAYHGVLSGTMGIILMLWILIQCYFLQSLGILHIIYFCFGAIQGLLAFVLLYRQNDFPVNILRKMIEKVLKQKITNDPRRF